MRYQIRDETRLVGTLAQRCAKSVVGFLSGGGSMRQTNRTLTIGLVTGVGLFLAGQAMGRAQQPQAATGPILIISEFVLAPGVAPNDAITERSQWVRDMRKTGEFNSVRLYTHRWGPEQALYLILEPKSWQAIESGYNKLFAARPDLLTKPFPWARHSDNILTEIPVQ